MATFDCTAHGVTFNDRSAGAANRVALGELVDQQACPGDTIEFPFGEGDSVHVDQGEDDGGGDE